MKGMKGSLLLLVAFLFSVTFVSAVTVTVHGYDCGVDGSSCVEVDSNSCATSTCSLVNFTVEEYCDINTTAHIFKYNAKATGTVGSDLETIKDNAFTCGTCYKDADGDLYNDDNFAPIDKSSESCLPGYSETAVNGGDCNDLDVDVNPGATELCNYVDDDCSDTIDDNQSCVYWGDMNDIGTVENITLGDSVRLLIGGYGNYSVYDSGNNLLTSFIGSGASEIVSWTPAVVGSDYYFKTNMTGAMSSLDLDVLAVPTTGGNGNDGINISLLSPLCGEDFAVGTNVTISLLVYDDDDLLYGDVTVDGESLASVLNLTNGLWEVNYTLSEAGSIQILAYAENDRGERQKKFANIMVVDPSSDDKYTAACIDSPENFEELGSSTVQFLAESSAGIDCSGASCVRYEYGSSELEYFWTFSTCDGAVCDGFNKPGNVGTASSFPYHFPYPGDNWAKLEIEWN